MLHAIGDSLSDLASSDDEQDGEDDEDDDADTELGEHSDEDEPGWVMGKISKTVHHSMESFGQNQMKLDALTQPGCGDPANDFRERDMKYGTAGLKVPAVVTPRIHTTAASASPTTAGDHLQTLDILMPAVTSRPGSSQIWLGFGETTVDQIHPGSFASRGD
jgi:hypothetical protein